jgi:VanZ family protein
VIIIFFDNFVSNKKKTIISYKKLVKFFIFAVLYGAIIEVIQYFLPFRSAEWADLLSNSCGAILGIITVLLINKTKLKKNKSIKINFGF